MRDLPRFGYHADVLRRLDIDPRDPHRSLQTEWLLTNGVGGYAMGTVLGVNTRRYHGLLVAATKPPVGRVVVLHSLIEQLVMPRDDGSEEIIDLSTQMFIGPEGSPMLHPSGWKLLTAFEQPSAHAVAWTWRIREFQLTRTASLGDGINVIDVKYEAHGETGNARLRCRPMIALRDHHGLNASPHISPLVQPGRSSDRLRVAAYGIECELEAWRGAWRIDEQVWHRFAYVHERARGQDWIESLWSPGTLEFELAPLQHSGGFTASAFDSQTSISRSRRAAPATRSVSAAPTALANAAEQFIVKRSGDSKWSSTIIAGYPWFADWGRDAMISLPGLMLCTGRLDEASSVLHLMASRMRRGLVPNCFDDRGGEPLYNTVDASLWFIHAVHQCLRSRQQSSDRDGAPAAPVSAAANPTREGCSRRTPLASIDPILLRACREIVGAYREGTDFGIHMDSRDNLIAAGDATTQLTWMDAKRDGVVFTPRHGKAVEINALWYNALCCLAAMTDDRRERHELIQLSERVRESFVHQFWWSKRNCLHDVLVPLEAGDGASGNGRFVPDGRLRPNQILAVSLPHSMLDRTRQRAIVNAVRERLLTLFGLCTLDREDPGYRGRYEGDMFNRDAAYHNGTVWPWLIGPYCEAVLRVDDFSEQSKSEVSRTIEPLLREMEVSRPPFRGCLGQIAEIYDGDEPQRPEGCPAQAWSVAELVRIVCMLDGEHGSPRTDHGEASLRKHRITGHRDR